MKKRIAVILLMIIIISVLLPVLSSCGNMSMSMGKYNFKKIHVCFGEVNECYEIISWHDNEIGIECKLKDYGSIYVSEGNYMLVENICPICGK